MCKRFFVLFCCSLLSSVFLFSENLKYYDNTSLKENTVQYTDQNNSEVSLQKLPPILNSDLTLEKLQLILPELKLKFPTPLEVKTQKRLGDKPLKNLKLSNLKQILPELSKPFLIDLEPSQYFPDGMARFYEVNPSNVRLQIISLLKSYSEITEFFFDTEYNDWVLIVNKKVFFWADGRILPKDKAVLKNEFEPFFRYFYTKEFFEVRESDQKYFESFFQKEPKSFLNPTQQNLFLLSEIYGEISKSAIEKKLKEIFVFGQPVYVHKRVYNVFKEVILEMQSIKKAGRLKKFFENYANTYGFNWRQIEYNTALSNHALGIAVDIMAKYYGALNAFWYWESTVNKKWFLLKLQDRWHPPAEIVKIFEKNGFIWGGYWTYWDTMHFEYKPELLYIYDYCNISKDNFYTELDLEQPYNDL